MSNNLLTVVKRACLNVVETFSNFIFDKALLFARRVSLKLITVGISRALHLLKQICDCRFNFNYMQQTPRTHCKRY